jgi:pimeloyl-ACP methyl ester carboxylesterase
MKIRKIKLIILFVFIITAAGCFRNPEAVNDGYLFNVQGCRIYGSFIPPPNVLLCKTIHGGLPPQEGKGKDCFILLHGLGSNHYEWQKLCDALTTRGYGYLAYDVRGHGKSIEDKDGNPVNYKYFTNDWQKMTGDLGRGVKFLKSRGIREKNIIIIGASLGANIALNYYVAHPGISLPVLLSPGMEYARIEIGRAIENYGYKALIVMASPGDTYAWNSSVSIVHSVHGAVFISGEGALHGANMLTDEKIKSLIDNIEAIKTRRGA